ncbi:hypothetical protein BC831DRAFT_467451 [Entophlyctis helioformis]|nr:hypothetical protein BC831DRAFT_467451 [Entophlyctis helioformis]
MASVQTPEADPSRLYRKSSHSHTPHSHPSLATEPTSRTSSLQKPDPKSKKGKTSSIGVWPSIVASINSQQIAQEEDQEEASLGHEPAELTHVSHCAFSRYSATSLASASTSTLSAAAASTSLHSGRQAADTSRPQVSRPSTASSVSIRSALKQQPSLSSSALHAHRTAGGSQPAESFVSRSVIIGPKRAMSHAGIAPADTTAAAHTDSSAGQRVHQGMSQDVHAEQRPQRLYRSMDPALTGSSSSIASSARLSVALRKTVGPQLSPQAGPRGRTAVPQSGGAGHVGQRGPNAADR